MPKWEPAEAIALVFVLMLGILAGLVIWFEYTRTAYPESTADCPPRHVYIDWGETPQTGCMPEAVARELNVYPKPGLETYP